MTEDCPNAMISAARRGYTRRLWECGERDHRRREGGYGGPGGTIARAIDVGVVGGLPATTRKLN